jgi:hypothetical protein
MGSRSDGLVVWWPCNFVCGGGAVDGRRNMWCGRATRHHSDALEDQQAHGRAATSTVQTHDTAGHPTGAPERIPGKSKQQSPVEVSTCQDTDRTIFTQ